MHPRPRKTKCTQKPRRNASPIRTPPRRKILRHTTIPRRTILPAAGANARARTMAAATIAEVTAAVTADAAADGVVVGEEDALAEDARKVAPAADAISRPQNTLRRRAMNLAATTIAEASHAGTTTGVKTPRAAPVLLLPWTPTRSRSFFPANRSQNIAASPQRHRRQWLSTKRMISSLKRRKLRRGQLATWHSPPPQAAPTFPAGSRAAFPAGCWPMAAPKAKQRPPVRLQPRWKKLPPPRAQFSNPNLCVVRLN